MPQALELRGIVASEGLFAGPVIVLGSNTSSRTPVGSPDLERQALVESIGQAAAQIAELMNSTDTMTREILEFQAAMLEDPTLSEGALVAIVEGQAADDAWSASLDSEITGYENSTDEYFRARAADLRDIRDRVLRHLAGEAATAVAQGAVLFGDDLSPTRFLETDWSNGGAIALTRGSTTSHVAMLARSRGIPMVVNLGNARPGKEALVDALAGRVVFDAPPGLQQEFANMQETFAQEKSAETEYLLKPARLKNGSRIELLINVASLEELEHLEPTCCDGIGLMRSEFLFKDGVPLPDEEQQYQAYRSLLEWAGGRPVTIRTLDIGGDKALHGLSLEGERNPFLGLRGVRLMLARPDVFRTQLRALLRAAAHGDLKVMIPMVTVPGELAAVSALLDSCMAELERDGLPCRRPKLGIMVEVPATAIALELFRNADFFSIGSNDLIQYLMAASRDEPTVAALSDPSHPAVLKLIASVASFGREAGIPVSLCGDMAGDPAHLKALLDAGLTSLSVAPTRIGRVKRALKEI